MSSLGLVAIMLDEADYVDRWAAIVPHAKAIGTSFERVVVVDGGSRDRTVEKLRGYGVEVLIRPFKHNFSDQRNFACSKCDTDWIFELDADEIISTKLLAGMRAVIKDADRDGVDCIGIPRVNYLDGVRVPGPGTDGLDYQYRLHRRHCVWQGAVHEEITGFQARVELNIEHEHFLLHYKNSERHEARNRYYQELAK